jgi:hypothetical protein
VRHSNLTANVADGSVADICSAKSDVRFTPNSDRESEFPHKVMSALPLKADMCGALAHVCFGPIADIGVWAAQANALFALAFEEVRSKIFGARGSSEPSEQGSHSQWAKSKARPSVEFG